MLRPILVLLSSQPAVRSTVSSKASSARPAHRGAFDSSTATTRNAVSATSQILHIACLTVACRSSRIELMHGESRLARLAPFLPLRRHTSLVCDNHWAPGLVQCTLYQPRQRRGQRDSTPLRPADSIIALQALSDASLLSKRPRGSFSDRQYLSQSLCFSEPQIAVSRAHETFQALDRNFVQRYQGCIFNLRTIHDESPIPV